MSQGFDTDVANTKQSSCPARKNKVVADIKSIQNSLVERFQGIR
jgi:hypothetical protein